MQATALKPQTQVKTVCEELRDNLTKEEFTNASKYIKTKRMAEISLGKFTDLKRLFIWDQTDEGVDYWSNVYSRFLIK